MRVGENGFHFSNGFKSSISGVEAAWLCPSNIRVARAANAPLNMEPQVAGARELTFLNQELSVTFRFGCHGGIIVASVFLLFCVPCDILEPFSCQDPNHRGLDEPFGSCKPVG